MFSPATLSKERRLFVDRDFSRPTALIALRSDDLVVVSAEREPALGPRVEVVLDGDAAAHAVALAHAPELRKGGGALDAGRVDALRLVDVVGAVVAGDRAQLVGAGGGVVAAEGLNHVVLDQRVGGPAVDGQVAVLVVVGPVAVVRDDTVRGAGVPASGKRDDSLVFKNEDPSQWVLSEGGKKKGGRAVSSDLISIGVSTYFPTTTFPTSDHSTL